MLDDTAIEATMRGYFDACNTGNVDQIANYFTPDAVHYFPPGMYNGPFVGARTIAERWSDAVANLGSVWTVENIIIDARTRRAVMEWSHFKTYQNKLLRGDEWYEFDENGLITEIRAYYASPQAPELERLELGGFDYTERGYALESPIVRNTD